MNTHANLVEGSPLWTKGKALIEAASEYWKEYNRHFSRGAVVFLEGDDGQLVLFTRGEYKRALIESIDRIEGEPLDEHFFEKNFFEKKIE